MKSTTDILNVCVTGAAGMISYSFVPLLANGDVFGANKKINLSLLDIAPMRHSLEAVVMELEDSSFDLLENVSISTDPEEAFKDCDVVVFIGGMPRKAGMERKDLLSINGKIFAEQGQALNKSAKKSVKCLVVANPANTNCLILHSNAPTIPKENFSCLTRLDHNRAKSLVARRLNVNCSNVKDVVIWGNHSSTLYPDVSQCKVNDMQLDVDEYYHNEFITKVQKRGAEIISKKGTSSVFSTAIAIKDHLRDWFFGSEEIASMGLVSKGEYNVPEGIVFSYPVVCKPEFNHHVLMRDVDDFSKNKISLTIKELLEEYEEAKDYLNK